MTVAIRVVIGHWSGNLSKLYTPQCTICIEQRTIELRTVVPIHRVNNRPPPTKSTDQIEQYIDIVDIFHFDDYAQRTNINRAKIKILLQTIFTSPHKCEMWFAVRQRESCNSIPRSNYQNNFRQSK